MKNPLSFLSRKNLETSYDVLRTRFPLASIIVLILTGFLFYVVHAEPGSMVYLRIILSLIVTFFLSIGVSLSLEDKNVSYKKIWNIAPLIYGTLFYISMNSLTNEWMLDSITYFILHLVGFIGFLFFAPYITNLFYDKKQSIEYTNYFTRTAWAILMSCIVGGSLIALGFIAIASVVTLFDISKLINEEKTYANWAIISLSLVAPLYCLIHLPAVKEVEKGEYEVDRFFSFLIRYIATPFIVLYFIILYAYSVKVLMNFHDWPKGIISWMVIGFSSFGYLTYIFSKSYEEESNIITLFRKYFPYAVPAQILMLGYAIYLRIAQYDLTMNRYFVVIFGCWLALVSAYYILSQKKSLTIVSTSLTVIALVISVGPWSVYQLPLTRQYSHLIQNLTNAGMYKDGVISKKTGTIDQALENDIYSEIEYICNYSHCEKIKTLFAKELTGKEAEYEKKWNAQEYSAKQKFPGMTSWEIVNEVTTALNISNNYGFYDTNTAKYIFLSIKNEYPNSIFPLSISGYDTAINVYGSDYTGQKGMTYVTISTDKSEGILHNYNGGDTHFSLSEFNKNLTEKYTSVNNSNIQLEDLTTTITIGNIQMKLLFENYTIKNPKYTGGDTSRANYISGYALIKKK